MELQEIKKSKTKNNDIWRPEPEITINSESFPAIKGFGIANDVKMEIIGDVINFRRDKKDVENYTIKIKKIGIAKNDSRQIKAKSMAENETKGGF